MVLIMSSESHTVSPALPFDSVSGDVKVIPLHRMLKINFWFLFTFFYYFVCIFWCYYL